MVEAKGMGIGNGSDAIKMCDNCDKVAITQKCKDCEEEMCEKCMPMHNCGMNDDEEEDD